jgi:hypothetical protein
LQASQRIARHQPCVHPLVTFKKSRVAGPLPIPIQPDRNGQYPAKASGCRVVRSTKGPKSHCRFSALAEIRRLFRQIAAADRHCLPTDLAFCPDHEPSARAGSSLHRWPTRGSPCHNPRQTLLDRVGPQLRSTAMGIGKHSLRSTDPSRGEQNTVDRGYL